MNFLMPKFIGGELEGFSNLSCSNESPLMISEVVEE